ncbi:MAG: GNAT family N-acetyltransferase [Puniceicoccales bacterium]|jgi:RimJ/RimL family protein N-acetyltransferase|nr:GNAT family N-acetyltransferase [Puniceicoccales bacterium]
MSRHRKLETERLVLRPLEESDAERIIEFMGEKDVTQYLLFFGYPINEDQVRQWLKNVLGAQPEHCAYWAITLRKTGKLIGVLSLTMDNYHHKTEMGYWSAKEYWGKGYMTEAAWRAIEYSFDELKLHRVELTHMVANKGSQRVAEKLGYQVEGCWREGHHKDGSYKDVKIYGMLRVDYERAKRKRQIQTN